jgi:hypothetical protein
MINAKDAVVWINHKDKAVMVRTQAWGRPKRTGLTGDWCDWGDPIGAAYTQWHEMNTQQRMQLMIETAIDLTMRGYPLKDVLVAFAEVKEFRALGGQSFPMCRALTAALVGKSLEPNTMSFEELLGRVLIKALCPVSDAKADTLCSD